MLMNRRIRTKLDMLLPDYQEEAHTRELQQMEKQKEVPIYTPFSSVMIRSYNTPDKWVPELQDKLAETAKIAAQNAEVNFAEVLDEVPDQEEDATEEALSCSEDPEDEYIHLPVTPDGQEDVMDVQPQINPNLGEKQRAMLFELLIPSSGSPTPASQLFYGQMHRVEELDLFYSSTTLVALILSPMPAESFFLKNVNTPPLNESLPEVDSCWGSCVRGITTTANYPFLRVVPFLVYISSELQPQPVQDSLAMSATLYIMCRPCSWTSQGFKRPHPRLQATCLHPSSAESLQTWNQTVSALSHSTGAP
ncbi:hypothetical protein Pcinc_005724 [Petrolisthes cinctipes]|uniref:Uncharacterized protein n=1 Tax=Petrolisthes cinctipes TaxID=88211 RepID=A0AAE1KYT5_PETCI|nr:hypothetical protein Pcinc_005724 [Petrolisthes cinctipes]